MTPEDPRFRYAGWNAGGEAIRNGWLNLAGNGTECAGRGKEDGGRLRADIRLSFPGTVCATGSVFPVTINVSRTGGRRGDPEWHEPAGQETCSFAPSALKFS